jgi:hypothetical protein
MYHEAVAVMPTEDREGYVEITMKRVKGVQREVLVRRDSAYADELRDAFG